MVIDRKKLSIYFNQLLDIIGDDEKHVLNELLDFIGELIDCESNQVIISDQ